LIYTKYTKNDKLIRAFFDKIDSEISNGTVGKLTQLERNSCRFLKIYMLE